MALGVRDFQPVRAPGGGGARAERAARRDRENSRPAIAGLVEARLPVSALGGRSGDVGVVIWSVWVLGESAGVIILQNRAQQGLRERALDVHAGKELCECGGEPAALELLAEALEGCGYD